MDKKRVLVLFPTQWDAKQLASCRPAWRAGYEVLFAEPALADCPEDLDVLSYIESTARRYRGRIDGLFSSSDYPGATVASAIGAELGLASPPPEAVLRTSHKYYSRLLQREAAPEATPDFWLVDTRKLDELPELPFPVFVKPVKGAFSVHSKKILSAEHLRDFLAQPTIRRFTDSYLRIFNDMVTKKLGLDIDGHFFLVESFLHGVQVTVEGFVCRRRIEIYGIVDSIMHKDTGSFARFDYPSGLRDEIQLQMAQIAARVIDRSGLDNSAFNIEMIYDAATDEIRIIEINPRISGQFGDLYDKVDGRNSYVYALHVAAGTTPRRRERSGAYRMATSYPRRVFEAVNVVSAPDEAQVARVEALHRDALIWLECESGQRIDDFSTWEDGVSARYAVINVGAQSRRELAERLAAVERDLDIQFAAVSSSTADAG
jgi:hypothetical protein